MAQASPRGTYAQVAETLRKKISSGKIREGLPSEAKLMEQYGVSRSTIVRALKTLRADGVIESVPGSGWFVAGTGDRRPLVDRVEDFLVAQGLAVGDPFPSENALCSEFGVSRTAVRSAIAQLEGRAIVEMGPGRRRRIRNIPGQKERT
ncbi:GntR family transcriptional regulator [Streptomyces sp. WMMB303]|uniref:GntR family transcriptional regulator n=1 Tax=Streptomyces sp. WMMB303 TaxID=3034154 RepID=UPI0023ECADCF|nr:GntR family transcriptional regulator [Streptomyces sp. WMMB303]MDF4250456.1 GntR family transcriptional regulator [Streptomyces sp. WMMB303]